jgi:hypothetical protein
LKATKPLIEFNLGFPPEEVARACDIGTSDLRLAGRKRMEDDLALRARDS